MFASLLHGVNTAMKANSLLAKTACVSLVGAVILLAAIFTQPGLAYPRYNDVGAGGGCSDCHGTFSGINSPKGTVFPTGGKHAMHNDSNSMNTACDLCHTSGDQRNPFIKSSNGTANNPGLGCTGCHMAEGLRAHHAANNVTACVECHTDDPPPPAENVKPPYYGTVDTRAANPCNDVKAANTNENWSVGDFLGLDNDGNNLYDVADFACGPYRILGVSKEGNNARITWQTAGGRIDTIQAATNVVGPYSNVSSAIAIANVGIVATNYLEVGGVTNSKRFYRVKFTP
jgi:hypothetical protein